MQIYSNIQNLILETGSTFNFRTKSGATRKMYLSVLSLSLIFATVLGFSLSLVSAPPLISLLPCLPPNSPPPSCIFTITTILYYLSKLFSPNRFAGKKKSAPPLPGPVQSSTGSGISRVKMGGDAASQDMAPTVGGDASPPSARHLPLQVPPVSPPIGAAPPTPHLRVGALLKSTVFSPFFLER